MPYVNLPSVSIVGDWSAYTFNYTEFTSTDDDVLRIPFLTLSAKQILTLTMKPITLFEGVTAMTVDFGTGVGDIWNDIFQGSLNLTNPDNFLNTIAETAQDNQPLNFVDSTDITMSVNLVSDESFTTLTAGSFTIYVRTESLGV